jgi:hypothetical protein
MEFVMFEDVDGMEVFVKPRKGYLGQRIPQPNDCNQLWT